MIAASAALAAVAANAGTHHRRVLRGIDPHIGNNEVALNTTQRVYVCVNQNTDLFQFAKIGVSSRRAKCNAAVSGERRKET